MLRCLDDSALYWAVTSLVLAMTLHRRTWGEIKTIAAEASLLVLYAGSPFFGWPHKPIMCLVFGSNYERSYRHFRSAHSVPLNIALHLLGLVHAVLVNSALMHCLDQIVSPEHSFFSTSTFGLWVTLLLMYTSTAPLASRFGACAVLLAGFLLREVVFVNWRWMVCAEAILHALNFKYGDAKAIPIVPRQLPLLVVMGLCVGAQLILHSFYAHLADHSRAINMIALVLIVVGSIRPLSGNPINCYWTGYWGWVLALLTGQPWMYLHGAGFVASLFQGVSHEWTKEAANLPELANRTGIERIGDEIAHVSFFPVLICHSLQQSVQICHR